jgi:2-isopropylmalate synthase
VLCDTNGGMLPMTVQRIVGEVLERTGFRLGIHCQDDTSCAVANTVAAVQAGVTHVQCTANGYGERAGNADLFAVVGNLVTKMGLPVLPDGAMAEMMRVSHALAELANITPNTHQAYVGSSAFSHKAGLHASAIKVDPDLYNHLDPTLVGNDMHILITEMAGRASVELKARELGVDLSGRPDAIGRIVDTVKAREAAGWSYEAADASFELLMRDELAAGVTDGVASPRAFQLESYRVIVENTANTVLSEATVKVHVGGKRIIATAEGNGPVNALDSALRSAVAEQFPEFNQVELVDYKVRILAGSAGTDSITRVLVSSARGAQEWTTVGVHANVVEASWQALVDALVYALQPQDGGAAASTAEAGVAVSV